MCYPCVLRCSPIFSASEFFIIINLVLSVWDLIWKSKIGYWQLQPIKEWLNSTGNVKGSRLSIYPHFLRQAEIISVVNVGQWLFDIIELCPHKFGDTKVLPHFTKYCKSLEEYLYKYIG